MTEFLSNPKVKKIAPYLFLSILFTLACTMNMFVVNALIVVISFVFMVFMSVVYLYMARKKGDKGYYIPVVHKIVVALFFIILLVGLILYP